MLNSYLCLLNGLRFNDDVLEAVNRLRFVPIRAARLYTAENAMPPKVLGGYKDRQKYHRISNKSDETRATSAQAILTTQDGLGDYALADRVHSQSAKVVRFERFRRLKERRAWNADVSSKCWTSADENVEKKLKQHGAETHCMNRRLPMTPEFRLHKRQVRL